MSGRGAAGAGRGEQPRRPLRAARAGAGRRRLGPARRSCRRSRPRWRWSGRARSSPATSSPGRPVRPLDQPLPRLRARLRLLLRPADARLPRPVARPRLRDPARRQARRGAAAGGRARRASGYRPAPIAIGTNTDPYQPIEKRLAIMRGSARGAARLPPPGDGADQGRADRARRRHPRRDGAARARRGRAVGDDARPRLARAMEPRAAAPERRLQAIGDAGRRPAARCGSRSGR